MNRYGVVAAVAVTQLALTGIAVAPQLSARLTGESYTMRVQPIDPIDPFRGAYVALDYPDLQSEDSGEEGGWVMGTDSVPGEGDTIFVRLAVEDGLAVSTGWTRERPEQGPYLACRDREWEIACGIESWFVPQDEALEIEEMLSEKGALAEIRIDSRGNASITGLRER